MILTVVKGGLTMIVIYRQSSFSTTQLHLTPQPPRLCAPSDQIELCSVRRIQVTYLIYMLSEMDIGGQKVIFIGVVFWVTEKTISSDNGASHEDMLLRIWLAA